MAFTLLTRYFRRFWPLRHADSDAAQGQTGSATGKSSLRYYVYMSATKAAMMYPQVPPAFLKGAEAELKVNLGFVSSGLKARGPEEAKDLPRQVAAIERYLDSQGEIGDANTPKRWIRGTAVMRWGCVAEYASDIAFFGGKTGTKTLVLLGSSDSIVGAPMRPTSGHGLDYYTLEFFNGMIANSRFTVDYGHTLDEAYRGHPPLQSYEQSVEIAFRALEGTDKGLDFLALVLHHERDLMVATPLYVALAS